MATSVFGPPEDDDQLDPLERYRRASLGANQPLETPRIAGPGAAPMTAVSLPGLRGPNPDVQKARERLEGLEGSSAGVDDPGFAANHPYIHGIAKVGDVLGSIIAPNVTQHIPGTGLYHHAQIAQAQEALNEHEAAAQKEAQTVEETANAQKALNPTLTPEEEAYKGLTGQTNPSTGQPYTPYEAYQQIESAKAGAKPLTEDEKPVEDIAGVNKRLESRYQVLHPGQALPPQYTLQPGAKQRDYKAIDADLQRVEQAQGVKTQQDTANQFHKDTAAATAAQREQTNQDREQARQDRLQHQQEMESDKHQQARDKFVQPLQGAIDNAEYQRSYADGPQHTGAGDYQMLNQLQEAIVAGQKAGIRFTTSEQQMIRHSQNLLNSWRARWGSLTGGTIFSDQQRHEIADTMQHVALVHQHQIDRWDREHQAGVGQPATAPQGGGKDFGAAPAGKPEGATGTLPDGTKIVVKGGRLVPQ